MTALGESTTSRELLEGPTGKPMSYWQLVWWRLQRDKVTLAAAAVILSIVLSAILAPYLAPYDPFQGSIRKRLATIGTPGHILGTDEQGRDMLTRLLYGGQMSLIAGVAMGVWPRGSLVFFLAVSSVHVLISLALGLLISATSKSAAEAVQRSVIFSIPLVQLSGFIFPVHNMPTWLQWFPKVFPATHYIAVSRAIYLRSEGALTLWPELLFILAGGVVLVGLAVRSVGARG